jgi:hypothetical protein
MNRTKPCTPLIRKGRLDKAKQFGATAELIEVDDALVDAYVTNCVHAGIAAADVLCCARLGEHAVGQDHHEAVALLRKVDARLAKDLSTLLAMKTSAGYSDVPVTGTKKKQTGRAMARLLDAATQEV